MINKVVFLWGWSSGRDQKDKRRSIFLSNKTTELICDQPYVCCGDPASDLIINQIYQCSEVIMMDYQSHIQCLVSVFISKRWHRAISPWWIMCYLIIAVSRWHTVLYEVGIDFLGCKSHEWKVLVIHAFVKPTRHKSFPALWGETLFLPCLFWFIFSGASADNFHLAGGAKRKWKQEWK